MRPAPISRGQKLDLRKVGAKPTFIGRCQYPAHDLGVSADEEIGQGHTSDAFRSRRLTVPQVIDVGQRANRRQSNGQVEDSHTPTSNPVGQRVWLPISDA